MSRIINRRVTGSRSKSVYVYCENQDKGVGKQLLQVVITYARNKGIHPIDFLGIASIKLHLSMGFVEVGYSKQIGYKFKHWLNVKCFQLILV